MTLFKVAKITAWTALALASCPALSSARTVSVTSPAEFMQFARNVGSYRGATVLLEADLDLNSMYTPVDGFFGTFDGQGHTISNLNYGQHYSKDSALFSKITEGATIKNVVIDKSCIFNSSANKEYTYVSGVIGTCTTEKARCAVLNSVSMATVAFSGVFGDKEEIFRSIYMGGIMGRCTSSDFECIVRNAVNYGDTVFAGDGYYAFIGGIVGSYEHKKTNEYLQNVLNYGTIEYSGVAFYMAYIGGVLGYGTETVTKGCVNSGIVKNSSKDKNYIGSLFGYLKNVQSLSYCYYLNETYSTATGKALNKKYTVKPFYDELSIDSDANPEAIPSTMLKTSAVVSKLNAFAAAQEELSLSNWVLNVNATDISFWNNDTHMVTVSSRIVLLPSLEREGFLVFDCWYEDENLTTPLDDFEVMSNGDDGTSLYGHWVESNTTSTIFFDTNGEEVIQPITARSGTVIDLPRDVKSPGFVFVKWVDHLGFSAEFDFVVPPHNVTLHADWLITEISDADSFLSFVENVNEFGMTYEGITVTLGNDIDMDPELDFVPIAPKNSLSFDGTFDGKGHVIRNLIITEDSGFVGLFGYSKRGAVVKNVVLDSSCSIDLVDSFDAIGLGGIFGMCKAVERACEVSNSVNMASISYANDFEASYLEVGGIIGSCWLEGKMCSIKNCVNYGSIILNGEVCITYAGGVIGRLECETEACSSSSIANTLNYGTIDFSGLYLGSQGGEEGEEEVEGGEEEPSPIFEFVVGGVCGSIYYGKIENSVNFGSIVANGDSDDVYSGAICGYCETEKLSSCFWSSEGAGKSVSEGRTSLFNENYEFGSVVNTGFYTGKSLIDALNAYSSSKGMERWALNKASNGVKFVIGGNDFITYSSRLILLPGLASSSDEGAAVFNGWYKDPAMEALFLDKEVSGNITLYGAWVEDASSKNYTITFDSTGGSPVPSVSAPGGSGVTLPSSEREGFIFVGWVDSETGAFSKDSMTLGLKSVTLRAQWIPTTIASPEDYVSLVSGVQKGVTCEGYTIRLANDIDLAGYPNVGQIGPTDSTPFEGTFDGWGYRISNLKIEETQKIIGLFGVSVGGTTIRNVLLDKSCSFKTTSSREEINVGGIIARCTSGKRHCRVENSISMASIGCTGTNDLIAAYVGGIVGYLHSLDYSTTVQNCANYGNITVSGEFNEIFLGGILSHSSSETGSSVSIRNNINFGQITTRQAQSSFIIVGGIVAKAYKSTARNCVSHGKIEFAKNDGTKVGAIAGYEVGTFKNCFWNTAVEGLKWSSGEKENSEDSSATENVVNYTDFVLGEDIFVAGKYRGKSLVDALNAYADKLSIYSLSKWVLNRNRCVIEFNVSGRNHGILRSELILLPAPANYLNSERMYFYGWYNDPDGAKPLAKYELEKPATLYGFWRENNGVYTVTFDVGDSEPIPPVSGYYGTPVNVTEPKAVGNKGFVMWVDENGEKVDETYFAIPAQNTTIRAIWSINSISTPEELVAFADAVNSGIRYDGKEVSLVDDIDMGGFQGAFSPINGFDGVFNGNGHIIRGLRINSTEESAGLFGSASLSMTIKNVVLLDASVFVNPSYTIEVSAGGIIGMVSVLDDGMKYAIRDCLTTGGIRINTTEKVDVYAGGIVAQVSTYDSKYEFAIENCASYMSISIEAECWDYSIGGIVGCCPDCTIRNNLGAMKFSLATDMKEFISFVGGIVGFGPGSNITNCVALTAFDKKIEDESVSVGSITGDVSEMTVIQGCFWNGSSVYGSVSEPPYPKVRDSFPFDENITLKGNLIVTDLNKYAKSSGLSSWTYLEYNTSNHAYVPPVLTLTKNYKLVAPPPPTLPKTTEERDFVGWYMDKDFKHPYNSSSVGEGRVTVHVKWKYYSDAIQIEFDTVQISEEQIVEQIKKIVDCEDCFTIIEKTEDSENTAVIKVYFDTIVTAKEFVRTITEYNRSEEFSGIKRVIFIERDELSASPRLAPFILSIVSVVVITISTFLSNYF